MRTIRIKRDTHVLYIGDSDKDIDDMKMSYITLFYSVTHVVNRGDGWYDVYNGNTVLGFVRGVESVQERW